MLSTLTPEGLEEIQRRAELSAALDSPLHLGRHIFRHNWQEPRHIQYLNERVMHTIDTGGRLMVFLPPRHGKSFFISQIVTSWYALKYAKKSIILTSYASGYAQSWGLKAMEVVQKVGPDLGIKFNDHRAGMGEWLLSNGSGMKSTGVGGDVTGRGADLFVLDDAIKNAEEALSAVYRNKGWEWIRSVLMTRIEPGGAVVVFFTRWHEDDLAGRLIASDTDHQWEVVNLPALAEDNDILGRKWGEALWPARFNEEALGRIRDDIGPTWWCTPRETPILMADWSTKPISEVQVGDQVIGYDLPEGQKSRLTVATVSGVGQKPGHVLDYHMESGRVIRATKEHRWLVRKSRGYQTAKIGTPLRYIGDLDTYPVQTSRQKELWQYLAGIIDGEGHFARGVIVISQTLTHNSEVTTRIDEVLSELGIPHRRRIKTHRNHPHWDRCVIWVLHGNGKLCRTLLRHTMLAKRERAKAILLGGAGRMDRCRDPVARIEGGKDETVYALQTTTGNYVAWNYLSKNSALYQQRPSPPEGVLFTREAAKFYELRGGIVACGELRLDPSAGTLFATMDTAIEEGEANDYTVLALWCMIGDHLVLAELIRIKQDAVDHESLVAQFLKDHPRVEFIGLEDAPAEKILIQALRRSGAPVRKMPTHGRSKRARAQTAITMWQNGRILLPEHLRNSEVFEEIVSFDRAAHDDVVDVMSNAAIQARKMSGGGGWGLSTCENCGKSMIGSSCQACGIAVA